MADSNDNHNNNNIVNNDDNIDTDDEMLYRESMHGIPQYDEHDELNPNELGFDIINTIDSHIPSSSSIVSSIVVTSSSSSSDVEVIDDVAIDDTNDSHINDSNVIALALEELGLSDRNVNSIELIQQLYDKIIRLKAELSTCDTQIVDLQTRLQQQEMRDHANANNIVNDIPPPRFSISAASVQTKIYDRLSVLGISPDVKLNEVFDEEYDFDIRCSKFERYTGHANPVIPDQEGSASDKKASEHVTLSMGRASEVITIENILPYQAFIDLLMTYTSHDLVDLLRSFLSSVLGPLGDGETPPKSAREVDYEFFGKENLVFRFKRFLDNMDIRFRGHPAWRDYSSDIRGCCRDHLERYITNRIAGIAFTAVATPTLDEQFSARMQMLSFLKPEAFDIKPELQDPVMWNRSREELRQINFCKTPADKMNCVFLSAIVVYQALHARSQHRFPSTDSLQSYTTMGLGADDFLPTFIWIVLTSSVPKLPSNCEYIEKFHNPARMMSRAGYCFVNLRSAIEFILTLDESSVTMDPSEFRTKYIRAEREMNGGF